MDGMLGNTTNGSPWEQEDVAWLRNRTQAVWDEVSTIVPDLFWLMTGYGLQGVLGR